MKNKIIYLSFLLTTMVFSENYSCNLPKNLEFFLIKNDIKNYSDIKRNKKEIKNLCVHVLSINEHHYQWKLLLVTNPKKDSGIFWFLPHDNENTAFDAAIYATNKYGGGFLSVLSKGKRYYLGQDPNRNFSKNNNEVTACKNRKNTSSIYTDNIFSIIDTYKKKHFPYLALHNNSNKGGLSILKSTKNVRSFLAYSKKIIQKGKGLEDEDNLIYLASTNYIDNQNIFLKTLLENGINVKYELVSKFNNDCSLSNYVVLNKQDNYFNIETEHGYLNIQKTMIDILINKIIQPFFQLTHKNDLNLHQDVLLHKR